MTASVALVLSSLRQNIIGRFWGGGDSWRCIRWGEKSNFHPPLSIILVLSRSFNRDGFEHEKLLTTKVWRVRFFWKLFFTACATVSTTTNYTVSVPSNSGQCSSLALSFSSSIRPALRARQRFVCTTEEKWPKAGGGQHCPTVFFMGLFVYLMGDLRETKHKCVTTPIQPNPFFHPHYFLASTVILSPWTSQDQSRQWLLTTLSLPSFLLFLPPPLPQSPSPLPVLVVVVK